MKVTAMDSFTGPIAHGASLGAIIVGWLGWMLAFYPPVIGALATTVALCFYLANLWESGPVKRWRKNRKRRKIQRLHKELEDLKKLHGDDDV